MTTSIDVNFIVRYEVASSWWACHLSNPTAQRLAGKWYAWKVRRKLYRIYRREKAYQEIVDYVKSQGQS